MSEELLDGFGGEVLRVPFAVKQDVAADPSHVRCFRPAAQVPDARREADPVEQAWLARRHGIRWVDEVSLPV
jgi:hypothetical protein